MAKHNSNDKGVPNPRANMSAEDNREARQAAAKRKKANAGGQTEHNSPDLNRGRNARFVGWAKKHPVEACLQAQELFDQNGEDWKLELVRKHRIGQYANRRSVPKQPRNATSAPKRTYALPYSQAKIAELETAFEAAKTGLKIAKALQPGRKAKAIKALSNAKSALDKALAANERVSKRMAA